MDELIKELLRRQPALFSKISESTSLTHILDAYDQLLSEEVSELAYDEGYQDGAESCDDDWDS